MWGISGLNSILVCRKGDRARSSGQSHGNRSTRNPPEQLHHEKQEQRLPGDFMPTQNSVPDVLRRFREPGALTVLGIDDHNLENFKAEL